jgi:hypothetical protein
MTDEEKRKIYAALAAPFPEHCIRLPDGTEVMVPVKNRRPNVSGDGCS